MALDRWKLREDLVSIIAAGRELAPENDYALADIFLRHAREALISEVAPSPAPVKQSHVGTWIGAGCLALAGLLSPLLFFHGHHDADTYGQSAVAPSPFNHHQFDRDHWRFSP